jgi:hypothetical protein
MMYKNLVITFVFKKIANFRLKLAKSRKIDHNIDPKLVKQVNPDLQIFCPRMA